MRRSNYLFGVLPSFLHLGLAANIFVSHYSGTISTLTLSPTTSSLTLNTSLTIGGQPSWMTYDSNSRIIYVADETGYGTASLWTVSAATNGGLSLASKANAPLGAVANVLYGGGGYLASAHYQTSTLSTFKLPLTTSSSTLQTFALTMSPSPGAIPSRQDAPHPHEVILDPSSSFLLAPDLGADLIRIYKIAASTGLLTSCPSFSTPPGTGPRHGAFYGTNFLYVGNELANTVHAYTVSYPTNGTGCLGLSRIQSLTTMVGNKTAPTGTKVGEVHVKDNFLYVSNRRDLDFSPNDSMASFSLNSSTGEMTFLNLTSSGGTYPRTFQVNKKGDLVVIGDQTTANVAVIKRDVATGELGAQVASLRVGSVGMPENDNGLSAVLWDE